MSVNNTPNNDHSGQHSNRGHERDGVAPAGAETVGVPVTKPSGLAHGGGEAEPGERIPREIWILVAAAFMVALGFGLIAPILPQFARSFDVSVAAAGAVISAFAAMRLLFAPTSGALVNRFGSRRIYLIGLSTVALSTIAVSAAHSYWQLLILRGLGGIGSTMFTVSAMGLIVRIAPPHARGRASSVYATAFVVGNIFGPVLGAALSGYGMRLPFVLYGISLMIATLIVGTNLKASVIRAVEKGSSAPPMKFREGLQHSAYRAALCSGFYNGFANLGVRIAIVPLFAAVAFHRGAAVAGFALTAFAFGNGVVLQFSGKLADRYGRKPLVMGGLVVSAVFTAVIGFAGHPIPLLLVSALAGAGSGLFNPATQATLADIIGRDRSGGTVLSSFQMAQDAGSIVSPIVVGMLVDTVGYKAAFGLTGAIGVVALLAWVFASETLDSAKRATVTT